MLLILFSLYLFSQTLPVSSQDIPRHLDPALIDLDNPNPVALFDLYSRIYSLISTSNYRQAEEVLQSIEGISAPGTTQKVLNEYNELLKNIIHELNQTERSLTEAYSHLLWLREIQASESLRVAAPHLESANSSTQRLDSESTTLSNILKNSPIALQEGRAQVEALIQELDQSILDGLNQVEDVILERSAGLEDTQIQVSLDSGNPWVGSSITLAGSLSTLQGETMGDKGLDIWYNGEITGITTDGEGDFTHTLNIPYRYTGSQDIRVTYWPSLDDASLYSPSTESVDISPRFYIPQITLRLPDYVYPGALYEIQGNVSYIDVPQIQGISLNVFGAEYHEVTTDTGGFTFFIIIPDNASNGVNTLSVKVEPMEVYGPGGISDDLYVKRFSLTINLDRNLVKVSGQDARISGTVTLRGTPLSNSTVAIRLGEQTTTVKTTPSGRFESTFSVNLLSPSQSQVYSIKVTPLEPWIDNGSVIGDFYVLNSFTILGLVLIAGFFIWRKKPNTKETLIEMDTPKPLILDYNNRGGFPGVYIQALKLINKIVGDKISLSQTINEYLEKSRPKLLEPVYRLFSQISGLYERWFYGSNKSNPPMKTSQIILERMEDKVEEDSS
jgi:hypothetical protein